VFVALQYLLPHHLLCRLVYALTRSRTRWLKNLLIGAFMRSYRPAMADAAEPEPRNYESFNAFFTRALRPGARLSPADAQAPRCSRPRGTSTHSRRCWRGNPNGSRA
jgi:phosphatidylserine decarboxylase